MRRIDTGPQGFHHAKKNEAKDIGGAGGFEEVEAVV